MKRWALVIGKVHDNREDESELFVSRGYYVAPTVSWVLDRAIESQLYFDSEGELNEFKQKIVEYAKGLYQEYLKKEEETR